ncbi:MAG: lipid-A-disaccharide synthase [Ferruginibacter sp.]
MKYYMIAGEASGDLHGSNLIRELHKLDKNADTRCWGGDKMNAAGATLVKHYRDLAFMGFTEVIKNLPTIFRNLAFCKTDILNYKPDLLILIDYPGFNLRIAKWAKQQGIKVVFYISPQVWAWKENRVKGIKKNVDKMLVILPFEKEFYKKWDLEVEYVGHPLVEVVEAFQQEHKNTSNPTSERAIIALLPGSRKQEILKKLPVMLDVAGRFPQYKFIVAKAPGLPDEFYQNLLSAYKNVGSVANQTYELLNQSQAALVTSGTATLETALFGVPEIICYQGGNISYQIAKRLIKIKYIGLVNLIMDKEVVKELIQDELTVDNISSELDRLLYDETRKAQLSMDYAALKELLGRGGNASLNAAKSILRFLTKQ